MKFPGRSVVAVLALGIIVAYAGLLYFTSLLRWSEIGILLRQAYVVDIDAGDSLNQVATRLAEHNVISDSDRFVQWAVIQRQTESIKAGRYEFAGVLSPVQVLEKIVSGRTKSYFVTLSEGLPFYKLKSQLNANPWLVDDVQGKSDSQLIDALALHFDVDLIEGLFFPETYGFEVNTHATSILQRAHDLLFENLEAVWRDRTRDLAVDRPYDLLTMASIIEKESSISSERKRISGVIHRRLFIGMRLQLDPTVIYALGEEFEGNLRRNDLRVESPYNTYQNVGLPPSPIGSASLDSLVAAANPRNESAMYFVARGDGTSEFSATLKEHNAAVRKYQLN